MILCHAVLTPKPWTQGTRDIRHTRGLHIRDKRLHIRDKRLHIRDKRLHIRDKKLRQQRSSIADATQHWRRTPHRHHSRYADAARDHRSTGLHWRARVDSRCLWPSMDTRLRTPHVVSESVTVSLAATIACTFITLWTYSWTVVLSRE